MRTAKNNLTISDLGSGQFLLSGYFDHRRIRLRSADLSALETKRDELTGGAVLIAQRQQALEDTRRTCLTEEQLRDAEAAVLDLPAGRTLRECVQAARLVLGTGEQVECVKALAGWIENMQARRLEHTTIIDHKSRVTRFVENTPAKLLREISPKSVEDWIRNPAAQPLTQLGNARSLYAFFNFCVRQKWIGRVPIDPAIMDDLRTRARPTSEPDILTIEQCEKLLRAACATGNPSLALFVVLSAWCYMRKSEVLRLRRNQFAIHKTGKKTEITIHLRGKKVGSQWRDVSVPASLVPLVLECLERGAIAEPGEDGTDPKKTLHGWTLLNWLRVREAAGMLKLVRSARNAGKYLVTEADWSGNVLRHTGMSYLYQELGGDVQKLTQKAGNSPDVAFTFYLRHVHPGAWKQFVAISAKLPAKKRAEKSEPVAAVA